MSLVLEESGTRDPSAFKKLDDLTEGTQLLREYIFFNKFNFLKQCQNYDRLDTGKLTLEKFEQALRKAAFKFTDQHISDIVSDSPRSRKNEILYRQLYFRLSKGEVPKTKISTKMISNMKSSMLMKSPSHQNVEEESLETFLAKFFSTKTIYDFEHFDLNLLDTSLLREKNIPTGNQHELVIKKLYATNNKDLIENFQIAVAIRMYDKLSGQEKTMLTDEQTNLRMMEFLRKSEEEMFISMSELELGRILQFKFAITLTIDETNLLYFLIYREFSVNVVNLDSIVKWIKIYHNKRLKHVLRVTDLIADMNAQLHKRIEIPSIYQEIIKVIQELGFEAVETALGYVDSRNTISFDSFKKFLRQFNIGFTHEGFNEFKLWAAQEGLLGISNREDISQGTTYIVSDRLLAAIRGTCRDLFIPVTLPKDKNLTLEQAIAKFNRKVLETYWKNIEDNILQVSDSFRMVNELKIREILRNMVNGLDSITMNTIFDSLKYNETVSYDTLQRKIFVDEFVGRVKDVEFKPPEARPKQDAIPLHILESFNIQNINTVPKDEVYSLKPSINPDDTDPKKILEKLERILSELMSSPVMKFAKPEEKNIPTLPLLKIFESYDEGRRGSLPKNMFRRVLIESFPILNRHEIDTLVTMADQISATKTKKDPNVEASEPEIEDPNPPVPYYYFLLQIEKYFELNKLCRQYNGAG